MRRTSAFAAAAAFLLTGCYSAMREAIPDRPPGDDEVVLVGEVDFDPAVTPGGNPGVIDTYGTFRKYLVAFGDSPEVQVTYDSMQGIDQFAMVEPGRPFAIVAERHPTYLRMLRVNVDSKRTWSFFGGKKLTMYVVACTGALQIPIQPKDRYVYVGHLVCKHGDGPSLLQVDGSEAGLARWLPRLIGKHKLVPRLPRIASASTRQE